MLLILGYFFNNLPLFTGENLDGFAFGAYAKHQSDPDKYKDVMFIDTSFDKEIIDVHEDGDRANANSYKGTTEITNRQTLLRFLQTLSDSVDYKYVIVDLRFAEMLKGNDEETDKSLFDLICRMDRCVIADHQHITLLDPKLYSKSALADYKSTITATNFVRYQYYNEKEFIPLRVYNDLRSKQRQDTISHCFPFGQKGLGSYFGIFRQGSRLCQNSLFLRFEFAEKSQKIQFSETANYEYGISEKKFREMGSMYVNIPDELFSRRWSRLKSDAAGKYIIIGNANDDIHDTYAGPQSGPMILYNAIYALDSGYHVIHYWQLLAMFILYFLICFSIVDDKSVLSFVSIKEPTIRYFANCLSYTTVIFGYHVLEWLFGFSSYSFVLPVWTFFIVKLAMNIKKQYKR